MWTRQIFAAQLTAVREARGLTKRALAARVGVSERAIGQFEQAATAPALETLVALCQALETSADYLLGLDEHD